VRRLLRRCLSSPALKPFPFVGPCGPLPSVAAPASPVSRKLRTRDEYFPFGHYERMPRRAFPFGNDCFWSIIGFFGVPLAFLGANESLVSAHFLPSDISASSFFETLCTGLRISFRPAERFTRSFFMSSFFSELFKLPPLEVWTPLLQPEVGALEGAPG